MNRLDFTIREFDAKVEELDNINDFLDEAIENIGLNAKEALQIKIAVEEIFVNISKYAYSSENIGGYAAVGYAFSDGFKSIAIRFEDKGFPYNPLKKDDPDTTLTAEERKIGGLGILMVKKSMDNLFYEYEDGKNIFTIVKNLSQTGGKND